MKKIIFTGLLVSSTILFAKTDKPTLNKELSKEEKVLVATKNFKEEKFEKKIDLKPIRTPFSDCVLNNSITLFGTYFTMGIALDADYVQAAATAQCMADFGLFP